MRVKSAQNNLGGRYSPSGISINFNINPTDSFLPLKTILRLVHDDKEHYFQVSNATTSHFLEFTAIETGNSSKRFGENFDPRLLVDSKIEVVEDTELINKVRREANWT
jgi:hypothetical protein